MNLHTNEEDDFGTKGPNLFEASAAVNDYAQAAVDLAFGATEERARAFSFKQNLKWEKTKQLKEVSIGQGL